MADSVPHGGGLQGRPIGDSSTSRIMPKGAPVCGEISLPGNRALNSASCAAGNSVIRWIMFEVLAKTRACSPSTATPPQLVPPPVKGISSVPCSPGGVKRPSLRDAAIALAQASRSQGVRP